VDRANEAEELVSASSSMAKSVRSLSKGQRRKLMILLALAQRAICSS